MQNPVPPKFGADHQVYHLLQIRKESMFRRITFVRERYREFQGISCSNIDSNSLLPSASKKMTAERLRSEQGNQDLRCDENTAKKKGGSLYFARLQNLIRSHLPALLDRDRRRTIRLIRLVSGSFVIQRAWTTPLSSNLILGPRSIQVRERIAIFEFSERGMLCTSRSYSCQTTRQNVSRLWLVFAAKDFLEHGREERHARNYNAQQGFQV